MNFGLVFRCACLATLAVLFAVTPAGAAEPPMRWGEPTPIGPDIPTSWFPDLQTDPTGKTRVVWGSNLAEGDGNKTHAATGAVMIAQLSPWGWDTPRDIAVMDAGIASRPLIASDGRYVHVIYRTGEMGIVRLVYSRASVNADLGNAQSWSTPIALSEGEAYYAQIMVLPDGALVVLFNAIVATPIRGAVATPTAPVVPGATATRGVTGAAENATRTAASAPARRTVVLASRSTDDGQTWGFPTQVSFTAERVGRTSLAASADGQLLVAAWDEGYDNLTGQGDPLGIGSAISRDGGRTWQGQQALRSAVGPVEASAVVVGAAGPLLVYRATAVDRLLYRTWDGESWSDEAEIPGVVARPYSNKHNFDKLGLARDGDGNLLLAYVGTDLTAPKGVAVAVTRFASGQWSAPQRIAAPDGYPEYPRISVALGNRLELVFFVRDKPFDVGHYVMYGVAGQVDARAIAATTPAPPPAASTAPARALPPVSLYVAPTAQPAPAPVRAITAPLRPPQSERTGPALTILGSVLAVLLSVGGGVLLRRWLRF
jgi:hypothetical protein